jgi:type II secretion system protein C
MQLLRERDIRSVVQAIIPRQSAAIWLLSAALLLVALVRVILTITFTATIPVTLPPSPARVQSAQHAHPLTLTLFNEKNAWSPFAVGEIALNDATLREAPRSTLPVKVVGIVHHRSAQHSLAILSGNQQQFTVSVDEALPNYPAQVARIYQDRVILQHRGHYESLLLESDGQP